MTRSKEEARLLLREVLERKVSERAYQLYLARGAAHGYDLDDWLRAEQDVLGQSVKKPLFAA